MTASRPPEIPVIHVLGDVMVDVVAKLSHPLRMDTDNPTTLRRYLGGQATNTASWLAALDARTHLIGAIGPDPSGTWVSTRLVRAGVEHSLFSTDGSTGECIVLVTPDGKRTMIPSTGANALIGQTRALSALREGLTEHSGHVHLSGYLPYHDDEIAHAAVTSAKELGATCSIDTASTPQLRENRERLLAIVPQLDVLIGSLPELAVLAGQDARGDTTSAQIVDRLRQHCGVRGIIVLKRGPNGAEVDESGRSTHVPAHDVKVIDTTGAGDAMAAGFLAAWTRGASASEALQAGAEASAQAISTLGAHPASSINEGPDGN